MEQITVKVPGDTAESLATYAESQHDRNPSGAIRALLDKGLQYDDRITDLEAEAARYRTARAG